MRDRTKIAVAFAAIYLIWGSTYLAIATVVTEVPPVFMVAVRGMLAGGGLYLWSRLRGAEAVTVREVLEMLPTAALLFGGGYVLVGWAEQHVASGPAALLNATTPAWVVLYEWQSRRRARPGLGFAIALALGISGVGVLVGGSKEGALSVLPALACVCASVCWAAGTVRTRTRAHGNPVRAASVQLLTGGLLLLPISLLLGEGSRVAAGFGAASLGGLAYLVVVGSLMGYSAYVFLLHHVPASKVASHSYVNPLIAVLVGAVLASEELTPAVGLAALLILLSVYFIVTERSEQVFGEKARGIGFGPERRRQGRAANETYVAAGLLDRRGNHGILSHGLSRNR
jgi:drug/metabolite transporter (DMT)-like permease